MLRGYAGLDKKRVNNVAMQERKGNKSYGIQNKKHHYYFGYGQDAPCLWIY